MPLQTAPALGRPLLLPAGAAELLLLPAAAPAEPAAHWLELRAPPAPKTAGLHISSREIQTREGLIELHVMCSHSTQDRDYWHHTE